MVVSDLAVTAISGDDGVHALVQSLGSAGPIAGVELRLVARNNEVLATKTTGANGRVDFDPGLSRGKGGSARAFWSRRSRETTAFAASRRTLSISATVASPAAIPPPGSTHSSAPSAASIARAGQCSLLRFCATPRA
jgi:hypothetical protein